MLTMDAEPISEEVKMQEAPIPAEILAAIAAAAAVFAGKRLHIRSIEQLDSSPEPSSRWSRQGRVLVQSSHNLAVKHIAKAR
jgi:hypothetical protein